MFGATVTHRVPVICDAGSMTHADRWTAFDVDDATIAVSPADPVALIRRSGHDDIVVGWPDLDLGHRSAEQMVIGGFDGVWVSYLPDESQDPDYPQGRPAAVHIRVDGSLTTFTHLRIENDNTPLHMCGTTRHGLWLICAGMPDVDAPDAWKREQPALVLHPDGQQSIVRAGRQICFARDGLDGPALIVYAGAPLARSEGYATSYEYHYLSIPLPEVLPTETLAPASTDYDWDDESVRELMGTFEGTRVDPPLGLPGIGWTLVDLPPQAQQAAVDAVLREFSNLEDYWHGGKGGPAPLADGMSEGRVDVVGEWPHTHVDVSFTHPFFAGGRMRRRVPVFDGAGRCIPPLYNSIHLMEDLDTRDLPDPSTARDGILDI